MALTVLMNAGPWLPVPPNGYGGIENVIATLVPELRRRGVRVVLATVGTSTLPCDERFELYEHGRFGELQQPYNRVSGIAHAHLHRVLTELRHRQDIDLVHDHVEVVGLSSLALAGVPTLHTMHWDLGKHHEFYTSLDCGNRLWLNGVSADQLRKAPPSLAARSLGHVHLATPLAEGADRRPISPKERHVTVLGRITPAKGQDVAIRVTRALGWPLVLAGPVGPCHDPTSLERALADDGDIHANPDVRYWLEQVAPHVDGDRVRWVGTVHGDELTHLVGTSRAALFPICWDEPGGTAVTEALALGCPVVGFRRGCLPELVDHGRTGLLADPGDEDDLRDQLAACQRIDPAACAKEATERFTPAVMAESYLELYRAVLARDT
ncbi:MAG TPA: glycosyltransferase [Actinophytocola sp.]|nr:glycosyltransferase [Actinophytocola sp.]